MRKNCCGDRREQRDRRGDGAAAGRRGLRRGGGRRTARPARRTGRRGARRSGPSTLDVTAQESVDALAASLDAVRRPGQQRGRRVRHWSRWPRADVDDWQRMYDINVLGSLRVTQALLPTLVESGDGVLVMLDLDGRPASSYEGGGGYMRRQARPELDGRDAPAGAVGQPVRVIEIAPGMVRTEEFAVTRFRGDEAAAAKVYEGVPDPLTADDIADGIAWCVTRPAHVNIDRLVVRPRAQAAQHKVHRVTWLGPSGRSPGGRPATTGCGARTAGSPPCTAPLLRAARPAAGGGPRLRRLARHDAGAVHPAARGRARRRGRRRRDRPGPGRAAKPYEREGLSLPARRLRAAGRPAAGAGPRLQRAAAVRRGRGVALLGRAAGRLAPGGVLVEGTCSETGHRAVWVCLDGRRAAARSRSRPASTPSTARPTWPTGCPRR